jgi:protein pelota
MRVLHQDRKTGEVKVQVDSLDDLWHLFNIINVGDMVFAVTYRREEGKADKIRSERGEKRRMRLGLRVEKVEFHEFEDRLRILGLIEEGPQDLGSHHTFNMQEGEVISIIKERWTDAQLKRVKRAVEDARRPKIVFVSLEYDEAVIAVLRQFGIQDVAHIFAPSSGKMYDSKGEGDYYDEIVGKVVQISGEGVPIIILGPGFAKETLIARGKERSPEVFGRARVFHTGQAGMAGINELMKKGIGGDILEDSRVAMEVQLVEQVLSEISKDGLVAYGTKEVEKAVKMGAVDTLLILDILVRHRDLDKLMRSVEASGGRVVVVSEHHDAGRELDSIGGYAALLRFMVD